MPAFIANNGQFLWAVEGGGQAIRADADDWLWFGTFYFLPGDFIPGEFPPRPLQSGTRMHMYVRDTQYYVVVEDSGRRRLMANLRRNDIPGDHVPSRAVFTIERVDGGGPIYSCTKVALRGSNGNYVSAAGGGGGEVVVNRNRIGPWETFEYRSTGWMSDLEARLEPRPSFNSWVEYTVGVWDAYTGTPVPATVTVANPGGGDAEAFSANEPFNWMFRSSGASYPTITATMGCYDPLSWTVRP